MSLLKKDIINGWTISASELVHSNKAFPKYDFGYKIIESESGNLGLLLYDIAEIRMGWEICRLAIYENKANPKLIFNSKNLLCFYANDTIQIDKNESLIFLKVFISDKNKIEVPFLVLNLKDKIFSAIKIINSLPYKIQEVKLNEYKLIENYKDKRFESYDGRIIKTNELSWMHLNKIEEVKELYFSIT